MWIETNNSLPKNGEYVRTNQNKIKYTRLKNESGKWYTIFGAVAQYIPTHFWN